MSTCYCWVEEQRLEVWPKALFAAVRHSVMASEQEEDSDLMMEEEEHTKTKAKTQLQWTAVAVAAEQETAAEIRRTLLVRR
jgi:V8-like Glu-specific endopeptidase